MLTIKEICGIFNVTSDDSREVTSIEFDSRKVQSGSLFIPLAGTRDGHEFIQQAMENGAIASLWSMPMEKAPEAIVTIKVEDTLKAMQQLATYYRDKVNPTVVAITGSNGKTTTKDMTAAVLAQVFRTHKTQGNYNNDIGMPYTILQMPMNTEVLVLEMGMDHKGDLTLLSDIAKPDIAAITLIGEAHIEHMGSREGIAKGKMEIVHSLKANGKLVIPANEPLMDTLIMPLMQTVTTFGINEGDVQGIITQELREKTTFTVNDQEFTIPVLGSYNVKNALIAYTISQILHVTVEQIRKGLAEFQLTKSRTEWLYTSEGTAILSDVYNANPTAMGLVLDSFGQLPVVGRRFAVLADMLELGPDSPVMHAAMANHITDSYDGLFLVGEQMDYLAKELDDRRLDVTVQLYDATEKEALIQDLQRILQPQDMILLKGSNGMGLGIVVNALATVSND